LRITSPPFTYLRLSASNLLPFLPSMSFSLSSDACLLEFCRLFPRLQCLSLSPMRDFGTNFFTATTLYPCLQRLYLVQSRSIPHDVSHRHISSRNLSIQDYVSSVVFYLFQFFRVSHFLLECHILFQQPLLEITQMLVIQLLWQVGLWPVMIPLIWKLLLTAIFGVSAFNGTETLITYKGTTCRPCESVLKLIGWFA
uniref:Transmembrane protein n=1 Tax=Schistocephalus solidus TaxID=70667 RepID=A0A183SAJ3_SCHSO